MQLQPASWAQVLNGMLVLCGLAALIAFVVVKNRPWVAVFTVSLVLLGLSVASVLFSLVMVRQQVTVIPDEESWAVVEDRLTAPRIPLGPPDAPTPPGKPGDEPAPNQQEKVAAADAAKELSAARALIAQTVQAINLAIDEYKRITTAGAPPKITVAPPAAALESPPVVAEVEEPAVNASDEEPASSRPTWIDEATKRVGNTWREVVVTDEYATIDECYAERNQLLMIATGEFVKQFAGANGIYSTTVGPDGLERVHQPRPNAFPVLSRYPAALFRMGITADYLRREIAKDEYVETVERSFGPMKKLYTLVEFSPAVDNELRQRWAAYQRQERFAIVGIGAASILGLLSMVWGLLKVDTWTKGYYTKRLFLGVPLGILGLFGLYALLVEMGFDLPH